MEAASEKQASDIILLDTRNVCNFADFFVICSAESTRQIEAIYEEIETKLKTAGVYPLHVEGKGSGWLLMDFGSLIVHIFSPEDRQLYQLESLWDQAKVLVRIL